MMTVDDVLHRHLESRRELTLQPRGELGADRFDKDDPIRRDHEHREVVVHPRVVHVARQLADLLALVLRLLIDRAWLRECRRRAT